MLEKLDFTVESMNFAALTEVAIKQVTTTRYNKKVRSRDFNMGDLVLRWGT